MIRYKSLFRKQSEILDTDTAHGEFKLNSDHLI